MTAIVRRSVRASIPAFKTLATADDLDGFDTESLANGWWDVTGFQRVLIAVLGIGTPGTVGVDCLQESHDNGLTWAACSTLLHADADDFSGTLVASGTLNAAGIEPVSSTNSLFKAGPFEGPTYLRVCRDTSDAQAGSGVDWVGGAPEVIGIGIA